MTPLQLVAATAAVANGGALLRPHVVAAVSRGEARIAKYPAPPVAGRPISPATAGRLTRLLEGVVIEGTGKSAAVAGYRVAGKTGTAQIPVHGGYHGYLPSFVGFAPADRPALVGLVAIAEPQGNEYYGAQVAAPAFGAITRQVLLYRGIHPERERPTVWPGQSDDGGPAGDGACRARRSGPPRGVAGRAGRRRRACRRDRRGPGVRSTRRGHRARRAGRAGRGQGSQERSLRSAREVARMRLSELVRGLPVAAASGGFGASGTDPEVTGVEHDSRRVRPGDLFVALPGERFDGRAFAAAAVASGAVAVVGPRAGLGRPGSPFRGC